MDQRSQNVSVRSSGHRQQQQQQQRQRSSAPVATSDGPHEADDRNDYYYYYEYHEPRVVIGRDLRRAIEQLRSVPTLQCDRNQPPQDWNGKGGDARRTRKGGGSGGGSPQRRQVRSVEGSPPPPSASVTNSAGGRPRKSASERGGHRTGSDGGLIYDAADRREDGGYYGGGGSAMPWKIKRVRKHKPRRSLDQEEASTVDKGNEVAGHGSGNDGGRLVERRRDLDVDGGVEGGDEADAVTASCWKKNTDKADAETKLSTESLDSVVERILENMDGGVDEDLEEELREEERRRNDSKKLRRPQGAGTVTNVQQPSNQVAAKATVSQSSPGRRRRPPPPPPPKPKNISKNGNQKTSAEQRLETSVSHKNVAVNAEPNNNADFISRQMKMPPLPPPKPSHHSVRPNSGVVGNSSSSKGVEISLEDLFEQAVESLTDTKTVAVDELWDDERRRRTAVVDQPKPTMVPLSEPAGARGGKKYRGEDNFQQEVRDEDVQGPQCRQLKVVTTFDETAARKDDFSRISRGFAVVEKIEKKKSAAAASKQPSRADESVDAVAAPPEVEMVPNNVAAVAAAADDNEKQSTGERSTSFHQRTVISAATSSTPTEFRAKDDSQDGTQERFGQQQQQRDNAGSGLSRSSSATWDSVSVDSLLVYDDDVTTVRGVYSTMQTVRDDGYCGDVDAASTTTKTSEEYFVDSLKRLKREFQRHAAAASAERNEVEGGRVVDQSVHVTSEDAKVAGDVSNRSKGQEEDKISSVNVAQAAQDVVEISTGTSCLEQPSESEVPAAADDVARRPESEALVSRVGGDVAKILSDSTTTQEVTITVRLPADIRARMKDQQRQQFRGRRSQSTDPAASRVPFRELRLHREIRFLDADAGDFGRDRTGSRASAITSSAKMDLRICGTTVDSSHSETGNDELPVAISSSGDVTKTTIGGLIAIPGCKVEHESSSTSRSVDLVPCPTDSTPTRVDVTQVDSVRVLHVPGKGAKQRAEQAYEMLSLQAVVDGVRAAMLEDRKLKAAGVGVKCEAVETITSSGSLEGPDGPRTVTPAPVVHSIAVDCLPTDPKATELRQ